MDPYITADGRLAKYFCPIAGCGEMFGKWGEIKKHFATTGHKGSQKRCMIKNLRGVEQRNGFVILSSEMGEGFVVTPTSTIGNSELMHGSLNNQMSAHTNGQQSDARDSIIGSCMGHHPDILFQPGRSIPQMEHQFATSTGLNDATVATSFPVEAARKSFHQYPSRPSPLHQRVQPVGYGPSGSAGFHQHSADGRGGHFYPRSGRGDFVPVPRAGSGRNVGGTPRPFIYAEGTYPAQYDLPGNPVPPVARHASTAMRPGPQGYTARQQAKYGNRLIDSLPNIPNTREHDPYFSDRYASSNPAPSSSSVVHAGSGTAPSGNARNTDAHGHQAPPPPNLAASYSMSSGPPIYAGARQEQYGYGLGQLPSPPPQHYQHYRQQQQQQQSFAPAGYATNQQYDGLSPQRVSPVPQQQPQFYQSKGTDQRSGSHHDIQDRYHQHNEDQYYPYYAGEYRQQYHPGRPPSLGLGEGVSEREGRGASQLDAVSDMASMTANLRIDSSRGEYVRGDASGGRDLPRGADQSRHANHSIYSEPYTDAQFPSRVERDYAYMSSTALLGNDVEVPDHLFEPCQLLLEQPNQQQQHHHHQQPQQEGVPQQQQQQQEGVQQQQQQSHQQQRVPQQQQQQQQQQRVPQQPNQQHHQHQQHHHQQPQQQHHQQQQHQQHQQKLNIVADEPSRIQAVAPNFAPAQPSQLLQQSPVAPKHHDSFVGRAPGGAAPFTSSTSSSTAFTSDSASSSCNSLLVRAELHHSAKSAESDPVSEPDAASERDS